MQAHAQESPDGYAAQRRPIQWEKHMRPLFGSACMSSRPSDSLDHDGFLVTRLERVERYRTILADVATGEVLSGAPPSDLPQSLHAIIEAWVEATEQPGT